MGLLRVCGLGGVVLGAAGRDDAAAGGGAQLRLIVAAAGVWGWPALAREWPLWQLCRHN